MKYALPPTSVFFRKENCTKMLSALKTSISVEKFKIYIATLFKTKSQKKINIVELSKNPETPPPPCICFENILSQQAYCKKILCEKCKGNK